MKSKRKSLKELELEEELRIDDEWEKMLPEHRRIALGIQKLREQGKLPKDFVSVIEKIVEKTDDDVHSPD